MDGQSIRCSRPSRMRSLGASRLLWLLILAALLLGCRKKSAIGLDVDLYLHPESASPDDVLLQVGIQKELSKNEDLRLIHVRVVDEIVFLSGTVRKPDQKQTAGETAESTEIIVNNKDRVRAKEVRNDISIQD